MYCCIWCYRLWYTVLQNYSCKASNAGCSRYLGLCLVTIDLFLNKQLCGHVIFFWPENMLNGRTSLYFKGFNSFIQNNLKSTSKWIDQFFGTLLLAI